MTTWKYQVCNMREERSGCEKRIKTRKKMLVAIYTPILIILQAWKHSVLFHASVNQDFMNANERLLNNVERGCHRIGRPKGTKVKCPEKKEKLEIIIFALEDETDWAGIKLH